MQSVACNHLSRCYTTIAFEFLATEDLQQYLEYLQQAYEMAKEGLYIYILMNNNDTGPMNNYIVRSYRDVIVVTKIATRRTSKARSIVMY